MASCPVIPRSVGRLVDTPEYASTEVREADERDAICKQLVYRWDRIYSPIHALAFYCDPFYRQMRVSVVDVHGLETLQLGKGDIYAQCRAAIQMLCRADSQVCARALVEFMGFCVQESAVFESWSAFTKCQPQTVWTQALGQFPTLAGLLVKVYGSPASTAGVERQHKVSKRVHTAARNRIGEGKVEQQALIAHNRAVADMTLATERQAFEHVLMKASSLSTGFQEHTGRDTTSVEDEVTQCGLDLLLLAMSDDEITEQDTMSIMLTDVSSPSGIPDTILHPEREEY